jgi:hypothetical protein
VAFDQPVLVVGPAEGADGESQLVERVEALDPEQLLFEDLDRFLGAAVRLGFISCTRFEEPGSVRRLGERIAQRTPCGLG